MHVLTFLQLLSETFLFLEELGKTWSKMYIVFHVKYRLFLSNFNETWIFSTDLKNSQISNFMKLCPVVPCGWLERHDEANHSSSQFCKCAYEQSEYGTYQPTWQGYILFHNEMKQMCGIHELYQLDEVRLVCIARSNLFCPPLSDNFK
jgi:hypothetical protein